MAMTLGMEHLALKEACEARGIPVQYCCVTNVTATTGYR